MREFIRKFDVWFIRHLQRLEVTVARTAIFIVYFWFGLIKLLGMSPATPLVHSLFDKTINFMPFTVFYAAFSIFEMLIGILFLMKGLERVAIFMLGVHLLTTVTPLVLLPNITWQAFLVPTLEGQYIIKNVLIAACAVVIGSRVVPLRKEF